MWNFLKQILDRFLKLQSKLLNVQFQEAILWKKIRLKKTKFHDNAFNYKLYSFIYDSAYKIQKINAQDIKESVK